MKSQFHIIRFFSHAGLFILIALWSYAFFIKIIDFSHYQKQMADQPFAGIFKSVLTYGLLVFEGIAALLLIIGHQRSGLRLSLMLLIAFSLYILFILAGYFPERPCSCGGFISKMSWKNHLWFNLALIAINSFCLFYLSQQERRLSGTASKDFLNHDSIKG